MIREQIESVARTTAGLWKISQGDLKSLQVPLPSIVEQPQIVHRVNQLFTHADHIEQSAPIYSFIDADKATGYGRADCKDPCQPALGK